MLVDVSELDTSTTLLRQACRDAAHARPDRATRGSRTSQGELAVARAAQRAGVPYSLSTMSTRSIEEVAEVNDGSKWFQVYTWKDRGLVEELVKRARRRPGYEGLWLTVDTAVLGRRERDVRRGYTIPPKIGLGTIVDGVLHPAWTYDFLTHEPIQFANVVGHEGADGSDGIDLARHVMSQFDQRLSWDDIEWLRGIWDGPLMLKGIQTVDDARRAVSMGVEGIGLSNHGGRQLDDAPAPIELAEPVAQALQGAATIIVDGGVRRGSDVVKALALGAHGVSIGRPYLFGLGAAGERGRRPRAAVLPRGHRTHHGTDRSHPDPGHRPRPRPLAELIESRVPVPPRGDYSRTCVRSEQSMMRVLGIDPGLTRCGYAVVDGRGPGAAQAVTMGVIRTPASDELPQRLASLRAELVEPDHRVRARRRLGRAGVLPDQRPHGHERRPGERPGAVRGGCRRLRRRAVHAERGQEHSGRVRRRQQAADAEDGAGPPPS